MAVVPITLRDFAGDESKVDDRVNAPQGMISAHTVIQIDLVTEKFVLRLMHTHHSEGMTDVQPKLLFNQAGEISRFGQHALALRPRSPSKKINFLLPVAWRLRQKERRLCADAPRVSFQSYLLCAILCESGWSRRMNRR
jgi:hypothetical protein